MPLSAQRFRHATVAHDRLVPVSQVDANGHPRHTFERGRLIAYAPTLALGQLVRDHLARSSRDTQTTLVCDSADAIHEWVRLGLGLAWLPWSLAAGDCKQGLMVPLGGRADQIAMDIRLYRPKARQSVPVETAWNSIVS